MSEGSDTVGPPGLLSAPRTLVIGFGNRDREDDGVAYEVTAALRRRLNLEPLASEETGLERLGGIVDTAFVPQLAPEWVDLAAAYDQLIFVDAHSVAGGEALFIAPVEPGYVAATFTHHMTPAMFVALLEAFHRRQLASWLVSVRGHSFGFGRGLSEAAADWVEPAVEAIARLLTEPVGPTAPTVAAYADQSAV